MGTKLGKSKMFSIYRNSIFTSKQAQNMSVELIFTVALFVAFFVLAFAIVIMNQNDELTDVNVVAQDLVTTVSDPLNPPVRIVETNGSVNTQTLVDISNLSSSELKELFGINAEFCFILVNTSGDVINISPNHAGVGSSQILIGGTPCGYNP
jgi:archaellum component FlaF (FlaF/FlaG flagellin family)